MIEGGAIVRSVLPGTTIETKLTDRDVAKTFLDNIFHDGRSDVVTGRLADGIESLMSYRTG